MTEMESREARDNRAKEAAVTLPPGFTLIGPPITSFTIDDVQAYLKAITPAYECRRCGSSLAFDPQGTYTETTTSVAYDPVTSSMADAQVTSTELCRHDDYFNSRSEFVRLLKVIAGRFPVSSPLFVRSDQLTGAWAKANADALNYRRGNRSGGKRGAESWDDVAERMRLGRYDAFYGLGNDSGLWYVIEPRP